MTAAINNDDNDRDKRSSNMDLARKAMELNKQARLQRESNTSSGQDDSTSDKKHSNLVGKSVNDEQKLEAKSYAEDAGSGTGARHVGSVIDASKNTDTSGGGSNSNGGNSRQKGDSFKLLSKELPKGKVKESVKLFGD